MAKFFFYDTDIVNLMLETERPSGGAAVQSYVWVNGLISTGHQVCVASHADKVGPIKSEMKHVELISIYDRKKGLRWIRWIYYRLPNIFNSIKKANPDYLYQSNPSWVSFFLAVFCKWLNLKYIIRIPNDNVLGRKFSNRYSTIGYALLRWGLGLSDYVLCQNEYQYSMTKKLYPGKKSLKIHNPFIFQRYEKKVKSKRIYFAWVANLRYVKNLKLLYEIAVLFPYEKFEIAGTYSRKDSETDEYLAKLKVLKNVNFRGHINREEILNFLSRAKYLLNTSRYEGFSNTFLEAMSVGTPILSTPNSNPDQIINTNMVGIVYEDSNDLKFKLDQISEEGYKQLSDHAIQYVRNKHDHIHLTNTLVRFLNGDNEYEQKLLIEKTVNAQKDLKQV